MAKIREIPRYLVLIFFSAISIYPLFWLLTLSLKTQREYTGNPLGWPASPTLDNFREVIMEPSLRGFTQNSIVVTALSVGLILVLSSLAGYALARMNFKGRSFFLSQFMITQWIPLITLIVPLLITIRWLGMYGKLSSLVFAYIGSGLGLSTFLMRGFFRNVPQELLDAARIDGCNDLQGFLFIMLPQVKSGLSVVAVVMFIFTWNEYFIALVLASDQTIYTLPLGIALFRSMYSTDWPNLGTTLLLSSLPTLLLYFTFTETFIKSASRSTGMGGR